MGAGGPARGGFGLVEKPKNLRGTFANLLQYLKPYWLPIVAVIVMAMVSNIFVIIGPKILGNITNDVVADYAQFRSINFEPILRLVELLLALYAASAIFNYLQGWIMSGISQKVTYAFRQDISTKINRLPLRYFDTRTYGEILSRITNDVDTVSQTLNQSLTQIVSAITTIIGILVMMLSISWQMTLVAILIVPLSFIVVGVIIRQSQQYFKDQQVTLGSLNGHIEEMYSGHVVMRVFGGAARSVAKFKEINNQLYASAWKSQFLSGLMFPIMSFLGNIGYVGVSVLGGYLAVKGTLQIGDIQAFIQYTNSFNQPIIQTANVANVMQSTAAAAERVFEFLAESEEVTETINPIALAKITGAVEFDNVVFGYEPDQTVIKHFTTYIRPGQRVAIVGPTGAGKTTIVNLLMRFYDVQSGSIRIDGTDIRDLKRLDLRRLFGMVLQDTWLFNGTIRENIAYSKSDATIEEIEAAATAAHVSHFIHALPNGYDTVLNEDTSNVSQGEKQLLTIARAMLANPTMLILDEATSSVDTRTEVLIQRAMDKLMEGKTSFVIAHRLSTIRNADLILVMKDGNIIEQGTHVQLMAQHGMYTSLYNSQFTLSA
jgi:ATP-binding cassette subfamily B protein